MSSVSIDVDITQAVQALTNLPDDLTSQINTNEILDTAGAALLNRMRDRFLREVDPSETPWVPSKAGLRRRLQGGAGTLFKTGRLFHSIQLHKVGDTERAISTDVPYAVKHQTGQGVHIRMFLGFNDEDQEVFTNIVKNMVNRTINGAS